MDGHDLREIELDSFIGNISMVFQNVYLFRDTVDNNIRFGKSEATREEVVAVAKRLAATRFVPCSRMHHLSS